MIYLNEKATSCLSFSIAYRVDLDEDTPGEAPLGTKRVQFGNRFGYQSSATGTISGTRFENVNIILEYSLHDEKIRVGVALITPIAEDRDAKATLAKFLASFRFR